MNDKASAWTRLPEELKALPQWAIAGSDKAPLSVDASGKLYNTSVNRPGEWLDFNTACSVAHQHGYDIGFILNESDPFTCIDLDVTDAETQASKGKPVDSTLWTTPEQFDEYVRIYTTFDSYTEHSRSGKGLHVWVYGDIGRGFRRAGVEVYSRERFIISTGRLLVDKPIADRQNILSNMIQQMRPAPKDYKLEEVPVEEQDWSVLERAVRAANKDKFCALWRGDWQGQGFPSQSEADLALMSMFTFYSPSNDQCRRLFRECALGKREKAVKDDRYLNFTLTTIRQRQEREEDDLRRSEANSASYKQELLASEVQKMQGGAAPAPVQAPSAFGQGEQRSSTALHVVGQGDPAQAPAPPEIAAAQLAPISGEVITAGESGLPWPPGFAGRIAQFIYQSAPRPVKEVSIVAALGLLAGLAGKAWHIPQSGLNLYIILIARSAVGKEAMHSGISAIIKACSRENPSFHKFVDFTEYASGQALIKACVGNPCFVNVSGEWGRRLKRIAQEDGRDNSNIAGLRTQMTNLYQKSGPQSIVGGIGYSNQDNNVASVAGVSYSMIGETTPGTFYEALTESMMEDGFLSRFLIIEYDGLRPEPNEHPILAPDQALRTALNNMSMQADLMIAKEHSQPIGRDEESAVIMKAFERECDKNINSTDDESRRQMWNRAALKSLRIAGLLAVADNWMTPSITREHIEWAQDVVRRDIAIMRRRLDGGDVGSGDVARERKLVTLLKEYLLNPIGASYKVPDSMRQNSIVPRSYLQTRAARAAAFYNHKQGGNRALDETINALIANGYLMDVDKSKVSEAYNYQGKAFRIIRLPDYDEQSKR